MQLSLTRIEKDFLYKKYVKLGMSPKEAYVNVKKIIDHLSSLVQRLRIKKKNEQEIQIKFRKEFERMCMELESKF